MTEVQRCELIGFGPEHMGALLSVFPDVSSLVLVGDVDDVGLQQVAVCKRLVKLDSCSELTHGATHTVPAAARIALNQLRCVSAAEGAGPW